MKTTRPTRIAITSGAAVLCLGVAAPSVAYACTGDSATAAAHPDTATSRQLNAPSLQQEQSWIDSFVSHRTAWLDHLSAAVSADANLTADQQAKAQDSIAKARTALTDLQSAVDAATSTAQVHDIVKAALEAMPMPFWPHPGPHAMARHAAVDQHAVDEHVRPATHHDRHSRKASPSDVRVRSADGTRSVHYATHDAWQYKDLSNRDFGAQHWSHPGDRGGDRGGHHERGAGFHSFDGGGDRGGWGH